jgi:hypothetical protein
LFGDVPLGSCMGFEEGVPCSSGGINRSHRHLNRSEYPPSWIYNNMNDTIKITIIIGINDKIKSYIGLVNNVIAKASDATIRIQKKTLSIMSISSHAFFSFTTLFGVFHL